MSDETKLPNLLEIDLQEVGCLFHSETACPLHHRVTYNDYFGPSLSLVRLGLFNFKFPKTSGTI